MAVFVSVVDTENIGRNWWTVGFGSIQQAEAKRAVVRACR